MNVVDMIVLGLIGVNAILGAVKGFALQAFRLASIVLAIVLARAFAGGFAQLAAPHIDWPEGQLVALGWVVIGAVTYLVMLTIGHYARSAIQRLRMGGADRALGALLGGLKGLAFALIGFHLITAVLSTPPVELVAPSALETELGQSRAFDFYLKQVQPVSEEWTRKFKEHLGRAGEKR